jgi:hypothetical protein
MGLANSHGDALRELLGHILLLEPAPPVLERALEPFPTPVRTLDALHLASLAFLSSSGRAVSLATYDTGLATAPKGLGIRLVEV